MEGEIVEIFVAGACFEFDLHRFVAGIENDSFARYAALENQGSIVDDADIGFCDTGLSV
jgi:hypothetical protein